MVEVNEARRGDPARQDGDPPMTLSERIELISTAMEGVTPGPWYPGHLGTDSTCQCRSIVDDGGYMGAIATVHVDNGLAVGDGGNDAPPTEEAAANMRYIAACNPAAISELLSAARKSEALQQEVAELREALKPFAAVEPVSISTSDGHISSAAFRRARTLLNGGSDAQG